MPRTDQEGFLEEGGIPQNGRKSLNGDLGQELLVEDNVEMCDASPWGGTEQTVKEVL